VYKDDDACYGIIYGHRRFLAAEAAGLTALKCIVRAKPKDEVELIELQAAENEHSKSLTAEDRENYISELVTLNVDQKTLAKKLHISKTLVTLSVRAREGRRQFGQKFKDAGIPLDTLGAYLVEGAAAAAVDEAIQEIKSGRPARTVLQEVAARKKKDNESGKGRPRAKALVEQAREMKGTKTEKMEFIAERLLKANKTRHAFDEFGDEKKGLAGKFLAGLLVGDVDELPDEGDWGTVKRCLAMLK
jgi:ParB-like chromosome segregation protein Spo0J